MPGSKRNLWTALVLGTFTAGACASAGAADDFPYEAYVAVDDAEVVSGPGQRYYATARLARGTRLEIYREETSGWLAIRPPGGSFSWVPAEVIERSEDEDDVGVVLEPTPAWIGTEAERVHEHRQQVTLKADEVVKILGEKQVASAEDGEEETWLRIAPPAGEFRWIHLRDVSRQEPKPLVSPESIIDRLREREEPPAAVESTITDEEPEPAEEPRRIEVPRSAIALRDIAPVKSLIAKGDVEAAQYKSTTAPPVKSLSPDGFVPRKRRGSEPIPTTPAASDRVARNQAPTFTRPQVEAPPRVADSRTGSTPALTATRSSTVSIDRIADQLEQLDVELSMMLSQEKSTWNLAGLKERVEKLVEGGSDPVARGQARLLLDKIKQFEEAFNVEDYGPIVSNPGQRASSDADAGPGRSPDNPQYDGQGWLKPVVSRRGDKPVAPFALVDADGKPICFVTPSPGMNLSRYLNKQVGVYGRRGYIESLKTAHVTTERIIDLDRQLR